MYCKFNQRFDKNLLLMTVSMITADYCANYGKKVKKISIEKVLLVLASDVYVWISCG